MMSLFKRSGMLDMPAKTRSHLGDIPKRREQCEKFAPKPAVFRVSMTEDTIEFDHKIELDMLFIHRRPILHIVDRGTRFSVARFLS